VILWLDHRAVDEAEFINGLKHPVLKYVGGKISLEMETPKLLWLKKNLKEQCWNKAGYFFDLPDFLTWKATGADSRFVFLYFCLYVIFITLCCLLINTQEHTFLRQLHLGYLVSLFVSLLL
jgi:ribulose kinase